MKKYCLLLLCLFFMNILLSGCNLKDNQPMVKSERRLGKYIKQEAVKSGKTIDLSEGPKLKYDRNFGPSDVNFDFKIVNPY